MTYQIIPFDLDRKLETELEAGEKIEWKGMPVPRLFKTDTIGAFLFSIPWTAFAIFWMCGAAGFKAPDFSEGFHPLMLFPLFGLPFVAIGLAMMFSPIWSYLKDLKTVYAITNKRVIIMTGGKSLEVKSLKADSIKELTRRERGHTGDLIISHINWRDSDNDLHTKEIGLFNIPEVREAQKALQKLIEQNSQSQVESESNGWRLKE
jgi:hypothetical protein